MPTSSHSLLRDHALAIWRAGLAAVRSDVLVREHLRVEGRWLHVADEPIDLDRVRRIVVVGGGKAGAGMADAVEAALGPAVLDAKQVAGWINVPADCVRPLARIHLHAARPPGVNEPTAEGLLGAERILELVASLGPDDLCLCLLSGGGSALLPAPAEGVSLADKLAVTRHLSAAGAHIGQINTVRKQLSRIKGGGLARACRAGRLITLVISDVPGDPLDVIASGPTVTDTSTREKALAVLEAFPAPPGVIPQSVFDLLRRPVEPETLDARPKVYARTIVIGNNARAVVAAGAEALRLGYPHALVSAAQPEGDVEPIGTRLAEMALSMRDSEGPRCLVSGGEGVVRLVSEAVRGFGGRNQQTVLAAAVHLANRDASGLVILSAGTDGEDGPTDAAGALVDADVLAAARQLNLNAADSLARNDAYPFFQKSGGLIVTGPTHTNVCDVRVVLVGK